MRLVRLTSTLMYYDGVQIFEGRDEIGGHYVGTMVDSTAYGDRYVVTGVAPSRLRQFRSGMIDLRTLLIEASAGGWYLAIVRDEFATPIQLERQSSPLHDQSFLPDHDIVLFDDAIDDLALQEARGRNNVIFEFSVEPPEAALDHRINASTLSEIIAHIQVMVRHAYRRALREVPQSTREHVDQGDGHLMDVVVPAAPGSFRVVMAASRPSDMFGNNELARALQQLDAVFESTRYPEEARENLIPYKGHLAGSYVRLLRCLSDKNTGLRYSWAERTFDTSRHGGVTESVAKQLVGYLSESSSLGTEEVQLTGELERADRNSGTWRLLTDEGARSGRVSEPGPNLEGLVIGNEYIFHCVEDLQISGLEQEVSTLYLRRYLRV